MTRAEAQERLAAADARLAEGALAEAVAAYTPLLALPAPWRLVALNNQGLAREGLGDLAAARADWEQAVAEDPAFVPALSNLARACWAMGEGEAAEATLDRALSVDPDHVPALLVRTQMHLTRGASASALATADHLVALMPEAPQGYDLRAAALEALGRPAETEAACRAALARGSTDPWTRVALGGVLYTQGAFAEAESVLRQALTRLPLENQPLEAASLHANLAQACLALGRPADAEAEALAAVRLVPAHAPSWNALGLARQARDRLEEARDAYEQAHAQAPDNPGYRINLAHMCNRLHDVVRAEAMVRPLLDHPGHQRDVRSILLTALRGQGRVVEADDLACRAAATAEGEDLGRLLSGLLFRHQFSGRGTAAERLALAREAALAMAPATPFPPLPARPRGHPLRVGYLSDDLYDHPVSVFLRPILAAHHRGRIEPHLYATRDLTDHVTAELSAHAASFTMVAGQGEEAITHRLRQDDLDVLVDLTGHTGEPHLGVIVRRAAPVQLHYLGYCGTTGAPNMDYWLGDHVILPPGEESAFSETLWRLDRCWMAYPPRTDAPPVTWRPDPDGTLWLGSFNQLSKLTDHTFALWGAILERLPRARLLLKTPLAAEARYQQDAVRSALARHGIDGARVEIQGPVASWTRHMDLYNRLDLALDPVGGHTGATTTSDTLWMGVPMVTRAGPHMAMRVSASMLTALAREEWITTDDQDYVATAVALAEATAERTRWRADQRARMAASPLCDTQDLTRALEDAFEAMRRARAVS